MTLDDIPADRVIILSTEMDNLFKAAYCRPTCHVCHKEINLGDEFQLVSYLGHDQMTCTKDICGRSGLEGLEAKRVALLARAQERQRRHPTTGTPSNGTGHFGKGFSRVSSKGDG